MDFSPITSKMASAASAVSHTASAAATGIKHAAVWFGHQVVWLSSAILNGIKVGATSAGHFIQSSAYAVGHFVKASAYAVGHFVKASAYAVAHGVQAAWHASYPHLVSTASFFKANLIKLGGFLASGPGVALVSSVGAVLLAKFAIEGTPADKQTKAVAALGLALIAAALVGVSASQAGLLPLLFR